MKNLTILFADDHSIFRSGLLLLIKSQEAYSSYKYLEAANGQEALNHLKHEKVDVIFSDINMPEIDGMELLFRIKDKHPECKVILMSQFDDLTYIQQAIEFNADAYLLKNTDTEEILKCIEMVLKGMTYYNPALLKKLNFGNINHSKIGNGTIAFSQKQLEILNLLCQEFTNENIANLLDMSLSTVKTHKSNLLEMTGAKNSTGLVLYAIKNNIFKLK